MLKTNLTSKSIIKFICIIGAFFVLEQIISLLLFNEIFTLIYEIIRPLFILLFVLLAKIWLSETKFDFNKWTWFILGGAFVLGALFNVLEYVRIRTLMQSIGNDFFSYLTLLTPSNSIYVILAKLCTYIFTFILLIQNKDLKNNIQN